MNKIRPNAIIILVGISVLILITIQTWRIIRSYRVYEEQIHKELDVSLFNSLKKESQIRYNKFHKKYSANLPNPDELSMSLFLNTAISKMFPEGCYLDLEKLHDLCSEELKKRKIRSKFQFEIEDLFRGHKMVFPKRGNYFPAARSVQHKIGSSGYNTIALTISNIDSYIFSNLKWSLLTSLLLVLINTACLFYMLYIIIRQKKISEMKNDFISNMTHEFKTPIATISAANQAMETFKAMNQLDRLDKYIGISKSQTNKLNNLVEEILNIAKYEKPDFKLDIEDVNINGMISNLIQQYKFNNSDFHFNQNIIEVGTIKADKFHLQNAINNIFDNAIKYSESVKIVEINLQRENNGILLSIKDYGKGISKDQQKYIFDRFYRAHTGDIHKVKGYGLGLSYVKDIIDRHKGYIKVKSQIGKGSEFFIYLPIEQEIQK